MLGVTVLETLHGKGRDVAKLAFDGLLGIEPKPVKVPGFKDRALFSSVDERALRLINCYRASPQVALLAYKARPLTGIWATAPYLHNGSVPTLNDLLLPPRQRPSTFFIQGQMNSITKGWDSRPINRTRTGFFSTPSLRATATPVMTMAWVASAIFKGHSFSTT
ncbi:hypothetical protein ACFS4T_14020 [Pseudomonas lini]